MASPAEEALGAAAAAAEQHLAKRRYLAALQALDAAHLRGAAPLQTSAGKAAAAPPAPSAAAHPAPSASAASLHGAARAARARARALEALGRYEEAALAWRGAGDDERARRAQARLAAAASGDADFAALWRRRDAAPPRERDAEEHGGEDGDDDELGVLVGPVHVRPSRDAGGNGLFVTRDVKEGQLLVVARPIAVATSVEALIAAVRGVAPAPDAPDAPRVRALCDSTSAGAWSLEGAVRTNAFGVDEGARVALFGETVSAVNHSCVPNTTTLAMRSGLLVVRAGRPLSAGEEVFFRYFATPDLPLEERRARCARWGFECRCPLCAWEASDEARGFRRAREEAAPLFARGADAFFASVQAGALDAGALATLVQASRAVESALAEGGFSDAEKDRARVLLLGGLNVLRAALEAAGDARAAVAAQDVVDRVLLASEPFSFEHVKARVIASDFAEFAFPPAAPRAKETRARLLRALLARYGTLSPDLERSVRAAVERGGPGRGGEASEASGVSATSEARWPSRELDAS